VRPPRLPRPPRLSPLLNQLIDSVFHPLARRDRLWDAVDTLAHWAVELGDQAVESLYKTYMYKVVGRAATRRGRARES